MSVSTYWNYTNGASESRILIQEKCDAKDSKAEVIFKQRSIYGPIPHTDLIHIIRNYNHKNLKTVNSQSLNWESYMIDVLRDYHFYVQKIVTSKSHEIRPISYITPIKIAFDLFKNTFTLAITHAVSLTRRKIFFPLGLSSKDTACPNPSFSKFIQDRLSYSSQVLWKILHEKPLNALLEGLLGIETYSPAWKSFQLYSQLVRTAGPLEFKAWHESKKAIFENQKMIPECFLEDPFLNRKESICPITQLPIRIPYQTPKGEVFEEAAIKSWIASQIAAGKKPMHPFEPEERLSLDDLALNHSLSDQIELRLLFLEAFKPVIAS